MIGFFEAKLQAATGCLRVNMSKVKENDGDLVFDK